MPIICNNCGSDNETFATFCHKCGAQLKNSNLLDRYPEFGFMPTSLSRAKGLLRNYISAWVCGVLAMISVAAIISGSLYMVYCNDSHDECKAIITVGGVFTIICLPLFISNKKKLHQNISESADYIQTKESIRRFPIVVNNDKMGIYDVASRSLIIPCKYDYMEWKQKGEILSVIENGSKYYIDIQGNVLK